MAVFQFLPKELLHLIEKHLFLLLASTTLTSGYLHLKVPWTCLWKLKLSYPHVMTVLLLWLVINLCPTLLWPYDCSLPASSVHGIFPARILEWLAISFSHESSWPRDWTCIFCIGRQILYCWAIWEDQDFKLGSPILETNLFRHTDVNKRTFWLKDYHEWK